jgi:hypothetical protein
VCNSEKIAGLLFRKQNKTRGIRKTARETLSGKVGRNTTEGNLLRNIQVNRIKKRKEAQLQNSKYFGLTTESQSVEW